MTSDFVLQTVLNALSLGGTYALLAIGLALIFSILGMINFAHGELMTVAGYVIVSSLALTGSFLLAALFAVGGAVLFAVLTERFAFRTVRGQSLATMLLTSYAVSILFHAGFQNLIGPRPVAVPIPPWLAGQIQVMNLSVGAIQLVSITATILSVGALVWLLRSSTIGIAMRAAAQDFEIAQLVGIKANRAIAYAFLISGVLAGIAGVLWVAQRGSVDPLMGFLPIIKAFIATVIGGMGSLVGAAVGGLVLGAMEVLLRTFLPDDLLAYRDGISLSLVIIFLLLKPNGLFGAERVDRQ